jgi:uncharacterized protein YyaL (SSP411 family)
MVVLIMRFWLLLPFLFLPIIEAYAAVSMPDNRRDWLVQQGILRADDEPKYINKLIYEDSPYLLSHALQPINWMAWSENIFAQAREDERLIYLSIGYETCHWCHVLAEESYVDESIASVLNQHFFSIKVDRERRPQVDQKYRRALENMTGSPGWPIQVILTPSAKIVWIDSYTPKKKLQKVLSALSRKWQQSPASIEGLATLQQGQLLPRLVTSNITMSETQYRASFTQVVKGRRQLLRKEQRGEGPRFLRANWLLSLLDEYSRSSHPDDLEIVIRQVEQLLTSPVYDFIDGGMHRYAEDGLWSRPHFEKMLYDQAQLIRVLVRLTTVTGQAQYLAFAQQIMMFVENKLKLKIGLYASSLSALSDGTEGGYYHFSGDEVPQSPVWQENNINGAKVLSLRSSAIPSRASLLTLKKLRRLNTAPRQDAKAVLAWNALYLLSLTELYQVDPQAKLLSTIQSLASNMYRYRKGEKLQRIVFQGNPSIAAQPEDYAWLFLALTEVHWTIPGFLYKQDIEPVKASLLVASEGVDWSNFHQDSELASAASVVMQALHQVIDYSSTIATRSARTVRKEIMSNFDALALQLNSSNLLLNWLPKNKRSTSFIKPFARGHGVVRLKQYSSDGVILEFELEKGWHINSNSPLRDMLIKTEVTAKDTVLKVAYPEPLFKLLDFNKQPLSLYEGLIQLPVMFESASIPNSVQLTVQACSDSVCLRPESIIITTAKTFK